jgi:hypothetical protein
MLDYRICEKCRHEVWNLQGNLLGMGEWECPSKYNEKGIGFLHSYVGKTAAPPKKCLKLFEQGIANARS